MNRKTILAPVVLALLCGVVIASPDDAKRQQQEKALRQQKNALERILDAQRRLVERAPQPHAVPPVPSVPDGHEMIVFAPHRPIRVAVTVRCEGKSIAEGWRAALRGAFEYFDRNGDGFLNATEMKFIFSDASLAPMMQSGFYNPGPNNTPTLAALDTDGDGKVSFGEYAAYYKLSAARVLQAFAPLADNPLNAQTTEALFAFFDRNGDGKLTRDEVVGIEKMVATKDADEDECLSFAELIPNFNDPRARGAIVQQSGGAPAPTGPPQNVIIYPHERIPGTLIQRLLKQYDKNGDYDLTQQEIGFDDETFSRLDVDHDGKLSGEDLDAWRTGPADISVMLSLAPKAVDCNVAITTDAKVVEAQGFSIRRIETGRVILHSPKQSVEFWAYGAVAQQFVRARVKQQLAGLFQAATKGKDYVEDKDLAGPNAPNFQLIRVLFDPADANADGKLTKAEFDRYLDLQQSFVDLGLSMTPAVQVPTLFQLIDENRDGRLSVRELRTTWVRLIALEESGATVITRSIIQPTISLRVSRVVDRGFVNQPVNFVNGNGNNPVVPQKGPLWFRKMDRNGDGDISRAEFLGTKDEFDAIDTDHDDLISLAEAESYDMKARGEKK